MTIIRMIFSLCALAALIGCEPAGSSPAGAAAARIAIQVEGMTKVLGIT
jgi:hypothetical protein